MAFPLLLKESLKCRYRDAKLMICANITSEAFTTFLLHQTPITRFNAAARRNYRVSRIFADWTELAHSRTSVFPPGMMNVIYVFVEEGMTSTSSKDKT